MRSALAVSLVAVVFAVPARAQISQPLATITVRTTASTGRQLAMHDVLLVARQGRVLGSRTSSFNGGPGWTTIPISSVADLHGFHSTLVENRVGQLNTSCSLSTGLPVHGTFELTWYGAAKRSRTLVMKIGADPSAPDPCSEEALRIYAATSELIAHAIGASTAN